MDVLKFIRTGKIALTSMWAGAAFAAPSAIGPISVGQAVGSVAGFEWFILFVLINVGGGASLLQTLSAKADEALRLGQAPAPLRNQVFLIGSHLMGSWLVGIVAFFAAQHLQLSGFAVCIFVPILSFGSLKAAEKLLDVTLDIFRGLLVKKGETK